MASHVHMALDATSPPHTPERPQSTCALQHQGVAQDVPKRWQTGHIILAEDRMPWWRHLSGGRHPLVFQPDHLTIVRYRKVTKLEIMWVNPNCTIIVCDESPGGRVEFAFLHPADIEEFAALVGGPPPPK